MNCKTIPELERFLTIQEEALGTQSPEVATTVSKLADLYLAKGHLDDAEALYRRALTIREKVMPYRREVEESRRSLNKVLALKSGDDKVEPARLPGLDDGVRTSSGEARSVQGVAAWWSSHSAIDPDGVRNNSPRSSGQNSGKFEPIQSTTDRYARESEQSKERQAIGYGASYDMRSDTRTDTSTALDTVPPSMVLSQDALALSEAINEARLEADLVRQVSGGSDPALADCLTRLADLYCRCKRYTDMEPLLSEALRIRELRYGPQHQTVATSLKNLARLYYFQSRFNLAQPLFERALTIRKRIFGDKHIKVAELLDQYAKLLRKMGCSEEADAMSSESARIRSASSNWRRI